MRRFSSEHTRSRLRAYPRKRLKTRLEPGSRFGEVGPCRGYRRSGVTALDRVEEDLVPVVRLPQFGDVGDDGQRGFQRTPERLVELDEHGVARRLRRDSVEARVRFDERRDIAGLDVRSTIPQRIPQRRDMSLGPPQWGNLRDQYLERGADLEHLGDPGRPESLGQRVLARSANEGPAALPGLENTGVGEHADGLPQGGPPDAEPLRQLRLGGQPVAGPQALDSDQLAQAGDDLVDQKAPPRLVRRSPLFTHDRQVTAGPSLSRRSESDSARAG